MSLLRYFAAVKEAAGLGSERVEATTLAEALAVACSRHDDRFASVLARCTFVVDGDPVGGRDHAFVVVSPDSRIDALPPFAGG